MNLEVVKIKDSAILPDYQTAGSAGADIHACIDDPIILQPMERRAISTGLAVAIPEGYEIQIRARSGLGRSYGVTMVNGVGTIDSDYRGEISVLLINLGQEMFTIEPGMRIAQMVLARYEQIDWQEVDDIGETERGVRGFGSTGVI